MKEAFKKQIIPLLQEYFYGDYGKIQLVLGEEFCNGEKKQSNGKFAKLKKGSKSESYDTSGFDEKVIYKIEKIDKKFDIVNAIKILLNDDSQKTKVNTKQEETAETTIENNEAK